MGVEQSDGETQQLHYRRRREQQMLQHENATLPLFPSSLIQVVQLTDPIQEPVVSPFQRKMSESQTVQIFLLGGA
jgi:hypothetical protein